MNAGEAGLIPWMDFSRSWTDADLRKEFGITQQEWDVINEWIADCDFYCFHFFMVLIGYLLVIWIQVKREDTSKKNHPYLLKLKAP